MIAGLMVVKRFYHRIVEILLVPCGKSTTKEHKAPEDFWECNSLLLEYEHLHSCLVQVIKKIRREIGEK
ncbi:hypothetical protein D3C85_1888490 [compost metagenome]